MKDYKFNHDWFSHNEPIWKNLIMKELPARKKFLEIGSFEGRSTVWIGENMADPGAVIHCIDTWEGGEEHEDLGIDMDIVLDNFYHNMEVLKSRKNVTVIHWREESHFILQRSELFNGDVGTKYFDLIYIDGSHQASDVLLDACLSWNYLKKGGVMIFDDYQWRPEGYSVLHTPAPAINAFISIFQEKIKIIHTGYQVAIKKIG